jgi:hypothetical protein
MGKSRSPKLHHNGRVLTIDDIYVKKVWEERGKVIFENFRC